MRVVDESYKHTGNKVKHLAITTLLVSILIFTLSSFFWDKFFEPNYVEIAHGITAKVAKKIHNEKNLLPIGTGGGMRGDIKMMAISFSYQQEVDIPTARELLVYCVEEYLSAINADEKVRPFLHNFPFTAKNIEIRIFFSTKNDEDVPVGKLSIASAIKGGVRYKANNHNYTLDILREETYEEALKLIQQNKLKKPEQPTNL
ncbi:MAG: hypothetical protein LLF94_07100 [Chlamydiales bacterium]|nr:hypothetical protein [Chlamydiales bacterium]